jgi:hypothetical protein
MHGGVKIPGGCDVLQTLKSKLVNLQFTDWTFKRPFPLGGFIRAKFSNFSFVGITYHVITYHVSRSDADKRKSSCSGTGALLRPLEVTT